MQETTHARALGILSAMLAIPLLVFPARVARMIGLRPAAASSVLRGVGLQEAGAAAGLLLSPRTPGLLWARTAGDLAHLAMLWRAGGRRRRGRDRVLRAGVAIVVVTVLDVAGAVRLQRSVRESSSRAHSVITLNRPPEEVYREWRRFERLPIFMQHLESVSETTGGRWRWVAKAPAGQRVEWEAEITDDVPGQRLAWRSIDGGDVDNEGVVRFTGIDDGGATEVNVDIDYTPPAGDVGVAIARLFGESPGQQLDDDLRRFKQMVEIGEVLRSDGTPEGIRIGRQLHQRPARPGS